MVLLKNLSNFWGTFKMPLNNCKISLMLNWSEKCFLVAGTVANEAPTFTITDTKLYVPIVTYQLLEQLKSGFKRIINWNKHKTNI